MQLGSECSGAAERHAADGFATGLAGTDLNRHCDAVVFSAGARQVSKL